jgi:tRNA-Thr(GGU) m(6)t(6)A37 methyltransferase TsaA
VAGFEVEPRAHVDLFGDRLGPEQAFDAECQRAMGHRARRDLLVVHPRDDVASPERGVFSTRSADRPNPIGLHQVEVLAVEGTRVQVRPLEALDGTPVVDIKPVLRTVLDR